MRDMNFNSLQLWTNEWYELQTAYSCGRMSDMNCKQFTAVDAWVIWSVNNLQLWTHEWYELKQLTAVNEWMMWTVKSLQLWTHAWYEL
jgi:hypothetical protein